MLSESGFNGKNRTTISDVFLKLKLPNDLRIIDIACGTGIVAEDLREHNYTNIDGLDPSKGYIEVAKTKGIYKVKFILIVIRK